MTARSISHSPFIGALLAFAVATGCLGCGPAGGGTVLVGGTPGDGTVSRGSSAQPGGWAAAVTADVWHADLTADMPVTILLCSTNPHSGFDPYLQLDYMGQQVGADDDSAGNLNARIVYTPTATGAYTIYVMSRGGTAPADGAAYTLRVLQGAMFTASCPAVSSP